MISSDLDIELHLKDIKYMFVDPELDPLENSKLQMSGVEEAADFLRIRERKKANVKLNIFLPQGQVTSDLQSKIADALSRYCDFKISHNKRQLEIGRSAGWRAIMIGSIFVSICLLMILIAYSMGPFSETLLVVFVGFFTILIWMAVWSPAEVFLYGLQPYRLEIKTYEALKNAEISLKEEM